LADNTWIIVTADHGEHFGEHGKYWHGNGVYRPLVDVPLLIVPPNASTGMRVPDAVSLRDLPATVVDLVGGTTASPFPGRSLRPYWDAKANSRPGAQAQAPLSEFKLPSEAKAVADLKPADRFHTAIVSGGRIYHRRPITPEELYDVGDREEAIDLKDDPEAAAALEGYRLQVERARLKDR